MQSYFIVLSTWLLLLQGQKALSSTCDTWTNSTFHPVPRIWREPTIGKARIPSDLHQSTWSLKLLISSGCYRTRVFSTFRCSHNCAKWSSVWIFPVCCPHDNSNELELCISNLFLHLNFLRMHNKLETELTTSFKFEVLPTTPFMMEKRFNSEFSPNGSWVNWYLRKLLVSSSMTGETLPETCWDLIYVRNVSFHRPVDVALRFSRIKVFWERVNLGKQILW